MISLLRLVEWYRLRPAGRDRLFQLTLASLEALQGHFGKPLCQISPSLLKRLYEAAKSFPAFTPGQQSQLDWCLDTTIFDIAHSEASSQELYNFHELQTDSIRHILGSTSWKVWKKLGQTGDANDGYSEEDETLYEMRRNFDLIFGKDSVISTTNVQSIF